LNYGINNPFGNTHTFQFSPVLNSEIGQSSSKSI